MDQSSIQGLSKKQIVDLYNVSYKTFRNWIKPFLEDIGFYRGGKFTPKQVEVIFNKLGDPR